MKDKLNKIREPEDVSKAVYIIGCVACIIAGCAVGVMVSWFNFLADNSTVWWQDIVGDLNLNVVFTKFPIWFLLGLAVAVWSGNPIKAAINELLFFVGVNFGILLAPKVFSGIGAQAGTMKWLLVGVIAAALALVFWYAKSQSWPSIAFDALIIGVLAAYCFDCGFVYFHFGDIVMDLINAIIIFLVVVVLASGVIQFLVSLLGGAVIALILGPVLQMS